MKRNNDRIELRTILYERFNVSELRTLCFDLGIDYNDLAGDSKGDKTIELVAYFDRHNRLFELAENIRRLRPESYSSDALEQITNQYTSSLTRTVQFPTFGKESIISDERPSQGYKRDYTITASGATPALILFLIDIGYHMKKKVRNVLATDLVYNAFKATLRQMYYRSAKGGYVVPRYHVGCYTYGATVKDIFEGVRSINEILTKTELAPFVPLNESGNTYAAFTYIERVLNKHIHEYKECCPAPLIYHITGGEYPGRNAELVAQRIRSMSVLDGHVLIENVLIDDEAVLLQTNSIELWPGIRDENDLAKSYARQLFRMSSIIPETYRKFALEMGYYLAPTSRMLYPGTQPEIISLSFVMPSVTGSR